jgi:hypothetical protein
VGKFVEIRNDDFMKYEALVDKPFGKVVQLDRVLPFYKLSPEGAIRCSEVFYDTPNDLLLKAGITLSKIQEDDQVFFKVCQNTTSKTNRNQKVFSHKVGAKDTLKDHAFYLMDGIRGLFSTPMYIDLEHVIQIAIPKVGIFINANLINVISGTGFRANLTLEETRYENYETKRNQKVLGMTVRLASPEQYMPEFVSFNDAIKKHCKDFIEVNDNIYQHVRTITRRIDAKQAKTDMKKAKEKLASVKADKKKGE